MIGRVDKEEMYSIKDAAPWTFPNLHPELSHLVQRITPCSALEVGCGEGYQAIQLAQLGFAVTGIDSSFKAILYARDNAQTAGVTVHFECVPFQKFKSSQQFDFVYDWRFLHEIVDEKERAQYAAFVNHVLKKNGHYLSVAFSNEAELWGQGRIRTTDNTDERLYFASLEDVARLFGSFKILEGKVIEVPEKEQSPIKAYFVFMEK